MIKIKVNGKDWEVKEGTTVTNLLAKLKISPKVCAVELNGQILDRNKITDATLAVGDKIEIIRMMGGG